MLLKYNIFLIFAFVNRAYKNSDFYMVHYWNNTKMCRSKVKCNPCLIADLLPKRRNAQNLTPLYGFGAILGAFFRYERLCFSGGILYRQPFKSRWLSLPGNKKAPYYYDAFVLLGKEYYVAFKNYILSFHHGKLPPPIPQKYVFKASIDTP